MRCCVCVCVTLVFLWTVLAAKKEPCERCEKASSCPFFNNLKAEDQSNWRDRFQCDGSSNKSGPVFGFSSSAQGVLVCCPENVWKIDNPSQLPLPQSNGNQGSTSKEQPLPMERNSFNYQPNYNAPNYFGYPNNPLPGNQYDNTVFGNGNTGLNGNQFGSQGINGNIGSTGNQFGSQRVNGNIGPPGILGNQFGNQGVNNQNGRLTANQFGYPGNNNPNNNQRYDNGNNGAGGNHKGYEVYENVNENDGLNNNQFGGQPYNNGRNGNGGFNQFGTGQNNVNSALTGNQFGNRNGNQGYDNGDEDDSDYNSQTTPFWSSRRRGNQPDNGVQNPYFLPANKDNSFRGTNLGGQCPVTSFPPDPDTGCCGREATNSDGINASPGNPSYTQSGWMPQANQPSPVYQPPWMQYSDRVKREDINVTFDNRIAGGKETDLHQFPWTVLLKTIFAYPTGEVAFSCGGSLISSRYVLTAGHCIFDSKGSVKDVEIYLAEYDKRTFPRDCKNVLGKGEVCVENIVMHAENYHLHPEYDDSRLHNDIALIRLRGNAPYTEYIRPICLPPINVDNPELSNLRLAVAGWGRNGQYKSNIKQSTVVNLVPQSDCRSAYPGLTRLQLCAAGYTGEDTCKGDSGGPLMMMYGGRYFVSGVVSGKRADAPCGTSVPSLYTNVFQYLPWIRSMIAN